MKTMQRLFNPGLKYLVMAMCIALAMAACVKDQEDSTILVKTDNSLHPFLFDQGSYWVYTMYPMKRDTLIVRKDSLAAPKDSIIVVRDSIHVQRDSVSVVSIEKDTLYETGNIRFYEYYRIKYHSSLLDSLYEEQLIGYVISRGMNKGGYTLLSSKKTNDKSMNAQLIGINDEMKVESRTYKQVVKMKVLKDEYISDNYFLYYEDNVGILRKEIIEIIKKGNTTKDSVLQTWNLDHYKVNLLKVQ